MAARLALSLPVSAFAQPYLEPYQRADYAKLAEANACYSSKGHSRSTLGGSRRFSCIYRDNCAPRSEAQANVRSESILVGRGLRVIVQSLMTRGRAWPKAAD